MSETLWGTVITGVVTIVVNLIMILPSLQTSRKNADAHYTSLSNELNVLQQKFNNYKASDDDRYAQAVRVRILHFDDSLCDMTRPYPSDSSFRQALQDCDTYEAYIKSHPDFINGIGEDAIAAIRSKYRIVKDKQLFGKSKDAV